jgi:hypothetical protein
MLHKAYQYLNECFTLLGLEHPKTGSEPDEFAPYCEKLRDKIKELLNEVRNNVGHR